jgi:hypothetical protein
MIRRRSRARDGPLWPRATFIILRSPTLTTSAATRSRTACVTHLLRAQQTANLKRKLDGHGVPFMIHAAAQCVTLRR